MCWADFREVLNCQILWKSVQWEPSCPCGLTDRQTDITKLIVSFRDFAKAPKSDPLCYVQEITRRRWGQNLLHVKELININVFSSPFQSENYKIIFLNISNLYLTVFSDILSCLPVSSVSSICFYSFITLFNVGLFFYQFFFPKLPIVYKSIHPCLLFLDIQF